MQEKYRICQPKLLCRGSSDSISGMCPLLFYHLGERVRSSNTSFKDGVAGLALTQCSPGDAGTYTCIAENAAGKQSSSAELHIKGKAGVNCPVKSSS